MQRKNSKREAARTSPNVGGVVGVSLERQQAHQHLVPNRADHEGALVLALQLLPNYPRSIQYADEQ